MEKYTTEQLREAACALFDSFMCDEKPEAHNCVKTCWAYRDKTRDELIALMETEVTPVKEYLDWSTKELEEMNRGIE